MGRQRTTAFGAVREVPRLPGIVTATLASTRVGMFALRHSHRTYPLLNLIQKTADPQGGLVAALLKVAIDAHRNKSRRDHAMGLDPVNP